MKKSISLLLIMALLIGGFVFMGNVIKEKHSISDLKVTILGPSASGDKALSDSGFEGGALLENYGINVSYVECKDDGFKPQMMKAAGESDLVVCMGSDFWEITDVTKEYPYTNFIWFGDVAESPGDYENLESVLFSENEGAYLAGYIAAAMSHSGVVGIVLGDDDVYAEDIIAGFTQGAGQANDSVEIITTNAKGNYNDFELGEILGNELLTGGADIIYQIPGKTGEGVLKAVKERGAHSIGIGRDLKADFPQYDDVILCSMKNETASAVFNLVRNYYDYGTFDGGTVLYADSSKRYISVSYGANGSAQLVDLDLTIQVNNLKQKIINREIKVKKAGQ